MRERPLAVLNSCDGCGACCLVVGSPPFVRRFDGEGEERWEILRRDHPGLVAELIAGERALRDQGLPREGRPCVWYDPSRRGCRHYELRPRACRDFALGGIDCRDARRRAGIEAAS